MVLVMKIAFLAALLSALLIAGCGDDSEDEAPAQSAATEEAQPAFDAKVFAESVPDDLESKPQVPQLAGPPATEFEAIDVVEGDGKEAKSGDTVSMQYVGVSWSTNQEFDASWDRGQAFETPIGQGQVIQGWDEGVPGMKEGGRRLLVIPPEMGYGAQGSPPAIGPNETLVFVVDLLKVK
jgi:peptidylprolyl isomerase